MIFAPAGADAACFFIHGTTGAFPRGRMTVTDTNEAGSSGSMNTFSIIFITRGFGA